MLVATESTSTHRGHCPVGPVGPVGLNVSQRTMVARILTDLESDAGPGSHLALATSDHAG